MELQINPVGKCVLIFWYLAFAGQAMQHLYDEVTILFCVQSVMSIVLVLNLIPLVVSISQFSQIYHGYILCSTNYILIYLCSDFYSFTNAPNHRSISCYPLIFYALWLERLSAAKCFEVLTFVMLFIL
jgi:hypothetical protein